MSVYNFVQSTLESWFLSSSFSPSESALSQSSINPYPHLHVSSPSIRSQNASMHHALASDLFAFSLKHQPLSQPPGIGFSMSSVASVVLGTHCRGEITEMISKAKCRYDFLSSSHEDQSNYDRMHPPLSQLSCQHGVPSFEDSTFRIDLRLSPHCTSMPPGVGSGWLSPSHQRPFAFWAPDSKNLRVWSWASAGKHGRWSGW